MTEDFEEEHNAREITLDCLIRRWEMVRDAHFERANNYCTGLNVLAEKIHNPYLSVKAYYNPEKKLYFYKATPVVSELREAIDKSLRIRRKE